MKNKKVRFHEIIHNKDLTSRFSLNILLAKGEYNDKPKAKTINKNEKKKWPHYKQISLTVKNFLDE